MIKILREDIDYDPMTGEYITDDGSRFIDDTDAQDHLLSKDTDNKIDKIKDRLVKPKDTYIVMKTITRGDRNCFATSKDHFKYVCYTGLRNISDPKIIKFTDKSEAEKVANFYNEYSAKKRMPTGWYVSSNILKGS